MRIFALKESTIISVHFMAIIAAAGEKGINVKTVSELTNCSRNHLSKLMEKLIKANLVYAKRGQTGGFYLNKKAEEIHIIDIIEAINGKIEKEDLCPGGKNICKGQGYIFGNLCKEISQEFLEFISNKTLEDIKGKAEELLIKNGYL
jgi:Rrf2 family protein